MRWFNCTIATSPSISRSSVALQLAELTYRKQPLSQTLRDERDPFWMVRSKRVQPQGGVALQVRAGSVAGRGDLLGVDQLTMKGEKYQFQWIRDAKLVTNR